MKKIFLFACVAAMFAACAPQNEKMTQCENGFMDLARARFAVREYAQTPVEQAKIDSILEAGRLAPTAKNVQPQHIYVLQSTEAISKINELTRCASRPNTSLRPASRSAVPELPIGSTATPRSR